MPVQLIQTEVNPSGTRIAGGITEAASKFSRNMADLIVNKHTFSANAGVIRAQNGMIGELLDIFA